MTVKEVAGGGGDVELLHWDKHEEMVLDLYVSVTA